MATPGITLLIFFLVAATIPASPPNKAIITSQIVGVVRASNSDWASLSGLIKK